MWNEFKKFAFKGNVLDMAVGVIVGTAFSKIVTSIVNDIIMPVFGAVTSGMDFKEMKFILSPATEEKAEAAILYGNFIQNVVDFIIIAFSIFLIIKLINKAQEKLIKKEEVEEVEEEAKPTSEDLLTEIRDLLKEKEVSR